MKLVRRRRRSPDKAPPKFRELSPAELKAVVGGSVPEVVCCLQSKATVCV